VFAADGTADGAPQLLTLAAAAALVDADVTLAGSGAAAVAGAAGEAGRTPAAVHPDIEPDARFLATVPLIAADLPLPLYARPPDAKPQIGKSLPRVAT
jgi:tRNA threonylcarbamoyladenosine biosynthesis protein TsaB